MKIFKSLSLAAIAILMSAGFAFAQVQQGQGQGQPQMPELPTSDDVSDEELTQLVDAINGLTPVQEKLQGEIEQIVNEEDISFERFQEMMMAMQNPQMADQANITEEEQQKIQTLQPKLMEAQGAAQEEMVAVIEDNGLTTERYQQIIMGAQQDTELRERVESRLDIEE